MSRISYKKALKEIEKLKDKRFSNHLQCYEPTLSDVTRVYQQYANNNPGDKALCMQEVFEFLAQEPIVIDYRNGKLYARTELTVEKNEEGKIYYGQAIRTIFIREEDKVAFMFLYDPADEYGIEYSIKLKAYLPEIKEYLREYCLKPIEEYNKLKKRAKKGLYIDSFDVWDLHNIDDFDVITDKEYEFLEKHYG